MKKKSSEKSFGIVFSVVFLIISLWPFLDGNQIRLPWLIVSAVLLILSFLKPVLLKPFNLLWMKLGALLGKVVPPIVMLVIFFVIVTPTSLIMRVLGKNLLNLKRDNKKTYWIERSKIKSKMRNQF